MNQVQRIAGFSLLTISGLFALSNGTFMLIRPFGWYDQIPTLIASGPPNAHFIRDIGMAYALSGFALLLAVWRAAERRILILIGAAWLSGHAVIHAVEVLTGICSPDIFWADFPGVFGPPLMAIAALFLLRETRA